MGDFHDNLLSDLLDAHGSSLDAVEAHARQRRRPAPAARRRLAGGSVVAVLAALGVTFFVHSPSTKPVAYSVQRNADNTVTVSIRDIKAIGPANAKLRALGVRAVAVPTTSTCESIGSLDLYRGDFDITIRNDHSVTLGQGLPEGYTVLLTVSDRPGRGTGLGFTAPVRDPAPNCVLDPADDPALHAPPTG